MEIRDENGVGSGENSLGSLASPCSLAMPCEPMNNPRERGTEKTLNKNIKSEKAILTKISVRELVCKAPCLGYLC